MNISMIPVKIYAVTGGAGTIGSALVRGLLDLCDGTVEVSDNLFTVRRKNMNEAATEVQFHEHDRCRFDAIAPVTDGANTAVTQLAHAPKFDLEDGLRRTLDWHSTDRLHDAVLVAAAERA